ncbi:MAG TPA: hypothetical protein VF637_17360 [Sphingomicrobium sp.]|jgi:hypothetical protein
MQRRWVTGWKLDRAERQDLLDRFAPAYPRVIADHVTLRSGTDESTPLPSPERGEIVGEADDGEGVQALVVRIAGTTDRGDGSTYHITWSLDQARGREPVESNVVIQQTGWRPVPAAVPLRLIPGRF